MKTAHIGINRVTSELLMYFWVSLVAFVLHAVEERRSMAAWAAKSLPAEMRDAYEPKRFTRALILIGTIYFVAILWNQILASEGRASIVAQTIYSLDFMRSSAMR